MDAAKSIYATLFRLFPCPTQVGLRRIGTPGRQSPVLVTCNFHLTVQRLTRVLREAGIDAWLLVADSRGVNVWCAAGAGELDTRKVVSAVKTSGIADEVDHRTLILPPLAAPAVRVDGLRRQTGWKSRWGPVRATDLPRYLRGPWLRDEAMRRVTYTAEERLDTALGSLFPIYLAGGAGFALLARQHLPSYLAIGAATFGGFMLLCPHLPGATGLAKVLGLELALATVAAHGARSGGGSRRLRAQVLIAMGTLLVWGGELGGLAPHMRSELDPLLARLGVDRIGNASFAGTMRTDLLNRRRRLTYTEPRCNGCRRCFEVCPVGVWTMSSGKRAVLAQPDDCTACGACLAQCPTRAITAPVTSS
ncbi:MAG: 4Fe-4S binding protein [Deltaproteobacteria bacterium]|jgi:NAD-dependent dihydropyrimidine dehydrogenase PreA subunit|nr:4Fe-4S binding protein [Deltaproteobacteria bacterium]MBW2531104.1 4Fe-4S binding protein [Deltaproteobacteria bacterium]